MCVEYRIVQYFASSGTALAKDASQVVYAIVCFTLISWATNSVAFDCDVLQVGVTIVRVGMSSASELLRFFEFAEKARVGLR